MLSTIKLQPKLGSIGLAVACLLASASGASAAPTTDSFGVAIASSSENLGGYDIEGIEPATLSVLHLHVTASAKWSAVISTNVSYESDDVRQGAELSVKRSAPAALGSLKVTWTVTGTLRPLDLFDIDVGSIPVSVDSVSCVPHFSGGAFDCTALSDGISLADTPCVPLSPYVELKLEVKFTVTPEGITAHRVFAVKATNQAEDDLQLDASAKTDDLPVPCDKPANSPVTYALDPYDYSPSTQATQQPHITIGVRDPGYALGCSKLPPLADIAFGPPVVTYPAFDLTGEGHTTDMGKLLANDISPTIAPIGTFSGVEGTPVALSALVGSQCPIGSSIWQFSNGTTSFGPNPQRTFGNDGLFNGQLTATDITGLSATKSFNVSIANVPPIANAGPDTSGAWGRPIALQGQGVDPGADDNATLVYAWDFGDGTPGTGGKTIAHAYTSPGDYVATLEACDDDTCSYDSTNVHVRKRATAIAYSGANTGVYSAPVQLGASLADEFGAAIAGESVGFTFAGGAAGTAQTNTAGNASRTITVASAAGSYSVGVAYAGSALYGGSSASAAFSVSTMATSVTYSGALSGGPNKSVTLSATLADALGHRLAGKVVVFQLGSQQVQATTNATGVASTSLKPTQKNGKYPLTATYLPSGADAGFWAGSAAATSFSLQAK
jgi:hypothetical protein